MQRAGKLVSMIANSPPAKRIKPNAAPKKLKKYKPAAIDPTSAEGVLRRNIADVWPNATSNDMTAFLNRDRSAPWPLHKRLENLEITALAANGSGLAMDKQLQRVVLVPYTLPGDVVNVQVYRTEEFYLEAELRDVVKASPHRDDSLVRCQYFGKCAGCQYQNTDYGHQLEIKRSVVANAYRFFAPNVKLPEIGSTVPSPTQYGYRTKLTPHFDVPKKTGLVSPEFPIGFGQKGRKEVLDIEECVIGTKVVNKGIQQERRHARENFRNYKRGATFLLREAMHDELVTDPRAVMREQVGSFVFEYKAGEFFQNNNAILPVVTSYVADALQVLDAEGKLSPPKFLVDTYCGCGLFAITCSGNAERVIGVEISAQNVEFARTNATLNSVSNAEFVVGQAEKIFEKVTAKDHDPAHTAVVIDPPRKGCDEVFLNQLLDFAPAKIVYVSCNVHSQARDLEYFLGRANEQPNSYYEVESLRGFDFFPQTYHVEGVAVLRKVLK